MIFQRKYNTATTASTHIRVPLTKVGSVNHATSADWTPAAGDVRIRIDGGAWANINTLPTASSTGTNAGQAFWEFTFLGAELAGKQIQVAIGDATSGKAVEDDGFIIETFGHASAMYPYDVGTDNTTAELNAIADAFLDRDMGAGADTNARSPRSALRRLRNYTYVTGSVMYVTKENDVTIAYQFDLTTDGAALPVVGANPTT